MEIASRCILSLIVPASMQLAKSKYGSLVWTIMLINPFTMVLLITTLQHSVSINSTRLINTQDNASSLRAKRSQIRKEEKDERLTIEAEQEDADRSSKCCSFDVDRVYIYYKYWLYSTHFTQLFSQNFYVFSSHQLSQKEVYLLLGSYALLIYLVVRMKHKLTAPNRGPTSILDTDPIIAMPLTETNPIKPGPSSTSAFVRKCDNICYLKYLAHPNTMQQQAVSDGTGTLDIPSSETYIQVDTCDEVRMDYPDSSHVIFRTSGFTRRFRLSLDPASASYSLICNILHLFILAQLLYLNATFSCGSKLSRFGASILIPIDCSSVYEDEIARATMFNAIFAGQLLACHLVYLCKSSLSVAHSETMGTVIQ